MNRGRVIFLLGVAAAAMGGCDMQGGAGGMVTRTQYDRAVAEGARQKAEAERSRAEAQGLRQDLARTAQDSARAGGAVKEPRGAEGEKANLELMEQVRRIQGRVLELQGQLADAQRQNESLRRENALIRQVMAQSDRLGASRPVAAGATPPVSQAAPATGDERARLLEQARRELEEAKAVLGKLGPGPEVPASMPAPVKTPGGKNALRGVVLLVRGAVVIIDVGSQSGLRKDMQAKVYRGEKFVGDLRLTAIGENTAEGVVGEKVTVEQGDTVLAGEKAGWGE